MDDCSAAPTSPITSSKSKTSPAGWRGLRMARSTPRPRRRDVPRGERDPTVAEVGTREPIELKGRGRPIGAPRAVAISVGCIGRCGAGGKAYERGSATIADVAATGGAYDGGKLEVTGYGRGSLEEEAPAYGRSLVAGILAYGLVPGKHASPGTPAVVEPGMPAVVYNAPFVVAGTYVRVACGAL